MRGTHSASSSSRYAYPKRSAVPTPDLSHAAVLRPWKRTTASASEVGAATGGTLARVPPGPPPAPEPKPPRGGKAARPPPPPPPPPPAPRDPTPTRRPRGPPATPPPKA